MLKYTEIEAMSDNDLESRLSSSKQELMKLREKVALRKQKDTSQMRKVRADVARLMTERRKRQIARFTQEKSA